MKKITLKETKGEVFRYWSNNEKNEPDFWKDRGEYNTSEMVAMAIENDFKIPENILDEYAEEYAQAH